MSQSFAFEPGTGNSISNRPSAGNGNAPADDTHRRKTIGTTTEVQKPQATTKVSGGGPLPYLSELTAKIHRSASLAIPSNLMDRKSIVVVLLVRLKLKTLRDLTWPRLAVVAVLL